MSSFNLFVIHNNQNELSLSEKHNTLAKDIILKAMEYNFSARFMEENSIWNFLIDSIRYIEGVNLYFSLSNYFYCFDSEDLFNPPELEIPAQFKIEDYYQKYKIFIEILEILFKKNYVKQVELFMSHMPVTCLEEMKDFKVINVSKSKLIDKIFEDIKTEAAKTHIWGMGSYKFIITRD